ncbi:MAG TPA: hypothetical protein VLM37_05405 [Fibrobacteraceae bacterium]|nr:hypothetical protein [Fibrobacteraceae bacterium]
MLKKLSRMAQLLLLLFIIGVADTWEGYYSYSLQGIYLAVSDSTVHEVSPTDSVDIIFDGTEYENFCHTKYGNYLWLIEDTSLLNFDDSLVLSDTSIFESITSFFFELDSSTSEVFVLELLSGNYALCKADVANDIDCSSGTCYLHLSDLYLACQVQDDGTTKFDSIPQYPYDTTESVLRTPAHTGSPILQGPPYRVNGARATVNGAVGVSVRAVGKE